MDESAILQICACLEQTYAGNDAQRREAEKFLESAHTERGFAVALLNIIEQEAVPRPTRHAASVTFKNFVKAQWAITEDKDNIIHDEDRALIKQNIVNLMLSNSGDAVIRKQLATSIAIISETDFPDEWPTLLPQMLELADTQDFAVLHSVLSVCHAIFRKYRFDSTDANVIRQVKYVVDSFAPPLLDMLRKTTELIVAHVHTPQGAELYGAFRAVNAMLKIFYSLNFITIPEFFEDHIQEFMGVFRAYLELENVQHEALLEHPDGSDSKPGVLHKVQANICNCITVYVEKYEEEFEPFLEAFMNDVWSLTTKLGDEERFDRLAIAGMQFLTEVARSVHYRILDNEAALRGICVDIVIPNVRFREDDEDLFMYNTLEYIRRDIEGSDSLTRRRTALELVKAMRIHFEQQVTGVFTEYINTLLQQYAGNAAEWRSKDAAMFLVTAISVMHVHKKHGARVTNELVPIIDFYATEVLPELQADVAGDDLGKLVLKADALKFSTLFRQLLPFEAFQTLFPLFAKHCECAHHVVHSYAAVCIESFLTVCDNGVPRMSAEQLQPFAQTLLVNLLRALPLGPKESKENIYVMKAIMRVVVHQGALMLPHTEFLLKQLVTVLNSVASNPSNPVFSQFLFETLAALITGVCKAQPELSASFEAVLFPVFDRILQADVVEYIPFTFQILSLLLEFNPGEPSPAYHALLQPLLSDAMWERNGSVPGLVRLMQAFMAKLGAAMSVHLEVLLKRFERLCQSKQLDHEGFYLLESLIVHLPYEAFAPYLPAIYRVVFSRLTTAKTNKFVKSFVIFLGLFLGKHEPEAVVQSIDSIQANIFRMVLNNLYLVYMQSVRGGIERKIMAIGSLRLLTMSPTMLQEYSDQWTDLLTAIVRIFELPPDDSAALAAAAAEPDFGMATIGGGGGSSGGGGGASSFSVSFSKLHYAKKIDADPFADVTDDLRVVLAKQLHELSASMPGKLMPIIASMGEVAEKLSEYFRLAGIPEPYLQ